MADLFRFCIKYVFDKQSLVMETLTDRTRDIKDLTPVRGKREKSQTPKGKISGLQRGSASLLRQTSSYF
jgi:hypothetical protein